MFGKYMHQNDTRAGATQRPQTAYVNFSTNCTSTERPRTRRWVTPCRKCICCSELIKEIDDLKVNIYVLENNCTRQTEKVRTRYYMSLEDNAELEKQIRELENENWELIQELVDLNETLNSSERENTKMMLQAYEKKQRIGVLERNYNRCLEDIRRREDELAFFTTWYLNLRRENEQLKKKLHEKSLFLRCNMTNRDEMGSLNKRFVALEKENRRLLEDEQITKRKYSEALRKKDDEIAAIKRKIESRESELYSQRSRNEIDGLNKRIDVLEKENRRLLEDGKSAKWEYSEALRRKDDEIAATKRKFESRESELSSLRSIKHIRAETEIKELKEKISEKEKKEQHLLREVQQKEKRILELEKNCAELFNEEYQNVLGRSDNEEILKNTIQHLQYEKNNHLAEIKRLEEKFARQTSNKTQEPYLIKEREELEERNKQLTNKIEQLKKDNALSFTKYIAACDEVKKLKTEVQQERTIIIQLQQNISEKESENVELKKAIKMKNEENDKLMKSNEQLVQEKAKYLEHDRQKEYDRSTDTEKELEQLRTKISSMEQEWSKSNDTEKVIHQLRAKVNNLEAENMLLAGKFNTSRSDDTEKELNALKVNLNQIKEEKAQLLNMTQREISQLRVTIDDLENEKTTLAQKLKIMSNEIQENLRHKKSEINILKENIQELTTDKRQLQNALESIRQEGADSALRASHSEEEVKGLKNEIGNKDVEIQQLQTKVSNIQKESKDTIKELNGMKKHTDQLKEKINQLSKENSNLQKENVEVSRQKEDALERLSRLAGAKLTHGNAAITDLSDTDRPTKIAEKFSELYDNAWTDAFEELDITYHNEKETINVLLKILQEAYSFCVNTEHDYEDRIRRAVFTLADEREITSTDVAVQKALADLRISLGNDCCSVIEEMFLSKLPSILRDIDVAACPKTKEYARQCASLCWRMRIREPPVFIRFEFRQGTSFNSDVLRKFTKTGGYLEFLVWPALYLHENGPLLAKGVAQPKLAP